MTDAPSSGAGPQPEVTPTKSSDSGTRSQRQSGRTRISAAWVGIIAAALVLVLLLVFILQNTRSVKISYFTTSGRLPLGVALLLAAIGGLLLAGVIASLRIWQLRHHLTRQGRHARPTHVEDADQR
ncbi:MAG: lipopolysaccharide assembly protein LapA domain-containing protein [Acidimicrobiales bacterium]